MIMSFKKKKKGINFSFGGYPKSRFSFDYILVLINQLGMK